MNNMTELDKLEAYLKEKGIKYKRVDEDTPVYMQIALKRDLDLKGLGEKHQIIVYDEKGDCAWDAICHYGSFGYEEGLLEVMGSPVVRESDEDEVVGYLTAQDVIDRLENVSPEQKRGEWLEKRIDNGETVGITEWQSARCSVCGRYHTTPYLYYFNDYNYCPNCGAKMKDE